MPLSHDRNKMYNSPIFAAIAMAMRNYSASQHLPVFRTVKQKRRNPEIELAAIEKRERKNAVRRHNFHWCLVKNPCIDFNRYVEIALK